MNLQFLEVYVQHFKSIRELKFYIHRKIGLHFVQGQNEVEPELESNGAGKSTIFDALCWIQFGKTPDGLTGPDLVPWDNGGSPSGTLVLRQDDRQRVIARTHSPNSLQLDGQEVTQEKLTQELGYSYEIFRHTMLLAQGQPLFFDLTKGEKLQMLTDAEGLDRWDVRAEKAAALARRLENETAIEHGQIDGLNKQLHELKLMSEDVSEQAARWEDEVNKRLDEDHEKLQELKQELEGLQNHHAKADLEYDSAETELKSIGDQVRQIGEMVSVNRDALSKARNQVDIAKHDVGRITKELRELVSKKKCSLCGQALHDKLPKIKELQGELEQAHYEASDRTLIPLLQTKEDLEKEYLILRKAQVDFTEKSSKALSTVNMHGPRISEINGQITLLTSRMQQDRDLANPFREQRKQLRERHDGLKQEVDQRTAAWRAKLQERDQAEYWSRAFRDIKLDIIKEILDELELACNLMLPQTGLVGWKIEFDIERETKSGSISRGIEVKIVPFGRKAQRRVKFKNWSGGEAQRLRLVGALALADVLLSRAGVNPNIQILDEPTSHISAGGVDDLVEFLAERAAQLSRSIFLADQTVIESGSFASTLAVIRDQAGTSVRGLGQ